MWKLITVGVLSTLSLLLSACGGGGQKESTSDDSWQPQLSRINKHIYLSEIDQIEYPDDNETATLSNAVYNHTEKCMAKRGISNHRYTKYRSLLEVEEDKESAVESVYSYSSPQDVKEYGVGNPDFVRSERSNDDFENVSDTVITAIGEGNPNGSGCLDQAVKALLPHNQEMKKILGQLQQINLDVWRANKPIETQAEKPWAQCMAKKGLPEFKTVASISSPDGDENGEKEWPKPGPSQREIQVGLASGECMIETKYLETVSKAKAVEVHKRLQKKPGLITRWKEIRKAQLEAVQNQK